jgi:hypothetical protein
MTGSLKEEDLENIRKITEHTYEVSFSRIEATIEKCMDRKFESVGMGDPDKVRRVMIYGEQCMKDKQNIRRGLFSSIGRHMATVIISVAAAFIAMKEFGN